MKRSILVLNEENKQTLAAALDALCKQNGLAVNEPVFRLRQGILEEQIPYAEKECP